MANFHGYLPVGGKKVCHLLLSVQRVCEVCRRYHWGLSDSWQPLWCGCLSTDVRRAVWCCSAALSAPPQIIAQERKSHSSQVSRPSLSFSFHPLRHPHTAGCLCACEKVRHAENYEIYAIKSKCYRFTKFWQWKTHGQVIKMKIWWCPECQVSSNFGLPENHIN